MADDLPAVNAELDRLGEELVELDAAYRNAVDPVAVAAILDRLDRVIAALERIKMRLMT